jgi:hypothetical protein
MYVVKSNKEELGCLIIGMRAAYMRGDNAMTWARANSTLSDNTLIGTLIAYDLQSGTYVDAALNDLSYSELWCKQLAGLLNPYITQGGYLLEVGVGEMTTLTGVIKLHEKLVDYGLLEKSYISTALTKYS